MVVDSATQKSVPLQLTAIGNVQTLADVTVRSLVSGAVVGIHFTEGQEVRKGDLLFTIDPRPLEAAVRQAEANLAKDLGLIRQAEANAAKDLSQVKQAEANLAKDTAQTNNAKIQAERYRALVQRQLVAQQEYDQYRTNAESLEATLAADRAAIDNAKAAARASQEAVENAKAAVQADRAALENARIQLEYASIRSPIDGQTGSLMVHRGDVVKANDTVPMVTINQINPVNVAFSLPEKSLPDIRKYMAKGKLKVEAVIPNDGATPPQGTVSFVDNAIDNATGTIQLKAAFVNTGRRLWPGQFVKVALTLATQIDAIVIPTSAIQTGQQGQFVFVVKADSTVESRPVVVDRAINDEAIVSKGVSPGETVVTDGQLQLVPGSKVQIKNPSPPKAKG